MRAANNTRALTINVGGAASSSGSLEWLGLALLGLLAATRQRRAH
jgi:MYXO-CTERM domain-containing protein